jgi:undecaprenyl diphosphate synthase
MHIAIIMDGNGRWAAARRLARQSGHRAGARAVDAVVQAAVKSGVRTLTLYAFSSDNWQRPQAEVDALFGLLRRYLITETKRCVEESVRLNVIGRRDRLPRVLLRQIEEAERVTAAGTRLHLRLAIDYSSRHGILEAARGLGGAQVREPADFLALIAKAVHSDPPAAPVDLLIRTGGERRLSDFLLWECAYAELHFVDCLWPDFDQAAFSQALKDFARRERRFGRIAQPEQAVEHG